MGTEQQQKVQVLTPVVTDEGWKIGMATWGEMGYTPGDQVFPTKEAARKICDEFNTRNGYNERQAWMIVSKTMFPGCAYMLEDVITAGKRKV